MKTLRRLLTTCLPAIIAIACTRQPETLFKLRSAADTGIDFNNRVEDNDTFNILTHEYIYNGGGVGIGDFNNDGRQDIFFTGNLVPNRLYLNRGGLQFEDVSANAGINIPGRWNSGVAVVDINNDGWSDIYVCATMHADSARRRNMLFINNGVDENQVPTFTNQASQYGVEDGGYCVAAAFFDYDKDDDLDLFLLINQRMDHLPSNYRPRINDGSALNNDKLYRNNGDGTFSDVTLEAGLTLEGFGLGVSVSDFNMDGWQDIYVSNDYLSNDALYINNGDGTFSNKIAVLVGHQSQFSMGNDAADVNNDGLPEIITTDMLPETSDRKKTTIGNKNYLTYINDRKYNYEHQYTRNMLHLNNGLGEGVKFSEIGQFSGIHQTEWSWSPLFADFDNDGFKDLIVTNGFPKDITDKDFANYRATVGNIASLANLKDSIPVVKIPNYAFRNNGDLTFADVTTEWGMNQPSFSNGAAFADLDNDGDLDYVVNNINESASVYENMLYDDSDDAARVRNFIRFKLADEAQKKTAVGAKVQIFYGQTRQLYENTIYRGFLSSVENVIHFGIGDATEVDSVQITWPDGNVQSIVAPAINTVVTVNYQPARALDQHPATEATPFRQLRLIDFVHQEDDKIDFNVQRTLPHKFSQSGPGLAVGDVNGDGLEDVIIGGSTAYPYSVFYQNADGSFRSVKAIRDDKKQEEDEGLLLFDANGDGHQDLYIVSGSIEHYQSQDPYQDRLFINDGKGGFRLSVDALPDTRSSGSCARAADFDSDGDLDLFVAGRVVPGKYPLSPASYLLRNDGGKFTDVSNEIFPALKDAGMIADGLWTDFDNDGRLDLLLVGEFTAVQFFRNEGSRFERYTTGLDSIFGWWNSIAAADFDSDNDIDYVVGNLGLNNNYQVALSHPLTVYAKDFDGNGSIDPVLTCFMRESMSSMVKKEYPVHFWDELNTQSPLFRNRFSRYRQYSKATIDYLLSNEERSDALILKANNMASSYIENLGDGHFRMTALPTLAQVAPVNGMVAGDFNGDGHLDVLLVGNDYGNEVFAGRYDACNGLLLAGDGKGQFAMGTPTTSGFYVPGDAKALARLARPMGDLIIATQNQDSLKVFSIANSEGLRLFRPGPTDQWAELTYADGAKQKVEFYYGSGYLSQSSRTSRIHPAVKSITVVDSKGNSRVIDAL